MPHPAPPAGPAVGRYGENSIRCLVRTLTAYNRGSSPRASLCALLQRDGKILSKRKRRAVSQARRCILGCLDDLVRARRGRGSAVVLAATVGDEDRNNNRADNQSAENQRTVVTIPLRLLDTSRTTRRKRRLVLGCTLRRLFCGLACRPGTRAKARNAIAVETRTAIILRDMKNPPGAKPDRNNTALNRQLCVMLRTSRAAEP